MNNFTFSKENNVYTLNFRIPLGITLEEEKYKPLVEIAFLQQIGILNKFSWVSKKYYNEVNKYDIKYCVVYEFSVDPSVTDSVVKNKINQFMIFGNWLYYLDYSINSLLSIRFTEKTIRNMYSKWKITMSNQIVSKIGQCRFRLKLKNVLDPLYNTFNFIVNSHVSGDYYYGIKLDHVVGINDVYDVHVWNEITHIKKLAKILSTKENVSDLKICFGKKDWVTFNNNKEEIKMMSFEDSNDPRYIKDIILDNNEKSVDNSPTFDTEEIHSILDDKETLKITVQYRFNKEIKHKVYQDTSCSSFDIFKYLSNILKILKVKECDCDEQSSYNIEVLFQYGRYMNFDKYVLDDLHKFDYLLLKDLIEFNNTILSTVTERINKLILPI